MKRGQVYYADLRPVIGSEQGGVRPVVIIQNDTGNLHSPTVIVAMMTTQKKANLPTHIDVSEEDYCLSQNTTILLEQLRTIDKSRLGSFVGRLSENTIQKIDEALHISLALNKDERKEEQELNELQIFQNDEFGSIRTVMTNNELWFVASDICNALDIQNVTQAVQKLDDDERSMFNIGRQGNANCVNEYGLYNLVLSSRKKEAKDFKRWITHEVIPQIRKTGGYQKQLSPQEMMRIQLGMIDDHEERIVNLENNMTIDYGQQRVLEDTVNKTVIEALGGKGSNAYAEIGRKVFAECNRDLKRYFDVNARNNVPKKRFDEAVEYAKNWKPCMNTRMLIAGCNTQLSVV